MLLGINLYWDRREYQIRVNHAFQGWAACNSHWWCFYTSAHLCFCQGLPTEPIGPEIFRPSQVIKPLNQDPVWIKALPTEPIGPELLMLFPRSSPRPATTPFLWRILVSGQVTSDFGNGLLLNRKVQLASPNKWINWRGRKKTLKGSLRISRNNNRRSTISSISISCS